MGVGFWNLSYIAFNAPVVYVLMGIVALAVGLLMMLVVIMPAPFKGMAQIMDILLLVFAIIFILWGLVSAFADDYGSDGGMLAAAGVGLLFAGMLRMGLVK